MKLDIFSLHTRHHLLVHLCAAAQQLRNTALKCMSLKQLCCVFKHEKLGQAAVCCVYWLNIVWFWAATQCKHNDWHVVSSGVRQRLRWWRHQNVPVPSVVFVICWPLVSFGDYCCRWFQCVVVTSLHISHTPRALFPHWSLILVIVHSSCHPLCRLLRQSTCLILLIVCFCFCWLCHCMK